MKKILLAFALLILLGQTFSSCTTMKRDCQGRKHTRLKNGIYL
jgi:hypothetical protein